MYSTRHKRPQVGANPYAVQNNMVHHCRHPASRAFLLFHRTHLPRLAKSSKIVTGYVKLHRPMDLKGADRTRTKLVCPLPFVPFGSFIHVGHLMHVKAAMSVMQISPCTNPPTMSAPFLTCRLGVSVLLRLLEHFNHSLQQLSKIRGLINVFQTRMSSM